MLCVELHLRHEAVIISKAVDFGYRKVFAFCKHAKANKLFLQICCVYLVFGASPEA